MTLRHLAGACLALALTLTACDADEASILADAPASASPTLADAKAAPSDPEEVFSAQLDALNAALAADGSDLRAAMAEWIGDGGSEAAGGTVIAKDVGNKQLTADFVPGDARRTWSGSGGDAITYTIDQTLDAVPFGGGLTAAQTDAAIVSAMDTWDGVQCSALGMSRNPDFGVDLGYIAALNGLGGSFAVAADVQHAGFRDLDFAGGVLGVAFTLIWTDAGIPTDIDGNGKADVAFREIYYDPSWIWGVSGGAGAVDVESIALHEAGHGLSQAHFGTVRIKNNGDLQASPRAVMNALYSGPLRALRGSDNGGHCSNWGQWPQN